MPVTTTNAVTEAASRRNTRTHGHTHTRTHVRTHARTRTHAHTLANAHTRTLCLYDKNVIFTIIAIIITQEQFVHIASFTGLGGRD